LITAGEQKSIVPDLVRQSMAIDYYYNMSMTTAQAWSSLLGY